MQYFPFRCCRPGSGTAYSVNGYVFLSCIYRVIINNASSIMKIPSCLSPTLFLERAILSQHVTHDLCRATYVVQAIRSSFPPPLFGLQCDTRVAGPTIILAVPLHYPTLVFTPLPLSACLSWHVRSTQPFLMISPCSLVHLPRQLGKNVKESTLKSRICRRRIDRKNHLRTRDSGASKTTSLQLKPRRGNPLLLCY